MTEQTTVLNQEQQARAEALRIARAILSNSAVFASNVNHWSPDDLIILAEWILGEKIPRELQAIHDEMVERLEDEKPEDGLPDGAVEFPVEG